MDHLCGWMENPDEVDAVCSTLTMPLFMGGTPRGNEPSLLYQIYRRVAGGDDLGVQRIGDCVSWGFKHLVDYIQATQIAQEIAAIQNSLKGKDYDEAVARKLTEFQMSASEVIYALSRVEVGGQRGSYQDGSCGAWAAKAIKLYGTMSYALLGSLGLGNKYDSNRAKQWGANGLPDELEPDAAQHTVGTVSLVTNFTDAAHLIENGYGIAVCSNIGFDNGGNYTTIRDKQGFAKPKGSWNHCMFLCGVRYDRPGLCCINQWPDSAFEGPLDLDQPKNSFWVDEDTVSKMLGQRDSWTASGHRGYPLKPLTYQF